MKKSILSFLLAFSLLLAAGCGDASGGQTAKTGAPTPSPKTNPAAAESPSHSHTPADSLPPSHAAEEGGPYPTPSIAVTRQEALEVLLEEEAPDFTLETLAGDTVSLSDYRGKLVFLSFWQTWCGPCRQEMPLFEQLTKDHDDVVVLAVNALNGEGGTEKSAESTVREFVGEAGFTFPVLLDRDGSVFSNAAYRSQYIPANYAIDREGILRYRMPGAYDRETMLLLLDVMRALSH